MNGETSFLYLFFNPRVCQQVQQRIVERFLPKMNKKKLRIWIIFAAAIGMWSKCTCEFQPLLTITWARNRGWMLNVLELTRQMIDENSKNGYITIWGLHEFSPFLVVQTIVKNFVKTETTFSQCLHCWSKLRVEAAAFVLIFAFFPLITQFVIKQLHSIPKSLLFMNHI